MQTNEVTPSPLERRIDLSVSLADIEKDVEARLARLARTVKMAGFRPGKVPLKLVSQQYGPQVRSEVLGESVERAFGEKVREQNLRVAGYPRIEPKEDGVEGEVAFSATFEVYPEVKLGDLSERPIERAVFTVTDAEVAHTLDVLRKQRAVYEAVDRASEKDDRVVVDFTGRRDGEVFEGGVASDFPVLVGGGQMLPEFDAQLVGVKNGDTKTFDLTFPEDYHAKNLAGATVQFEIVVKSVEAPRLPELDATFAKALGVADGDIEKMRAEIRGNLEREVKRRLFGRTRDQVLEALVDSTSFEVPRALVEGESQRMAEQAKQDLVQRGVDPKNVPVQPEWFTEQAARRVKLGLIVAEVVAEHKLQAKPEQVRAQVEELAQSYEQPAEFVKWYYAKPENLRGIEDMVVEANVVEWVLSQAKASDKVVTFEELMGNAPQA
ncbi:trigger factor [Uliginosibacterium sp. sgz301328]|uniref:trigger factor n=1 Tax=Uliginosibacterium sp. sgz301328 TaxID=3243764 RepID=UPI00359E1113